MAKVVLGIGTSHGPMLVTPASTWGARVPDDKRSRHYYKGRTWTFDELVEERRDERLSEQITEQAWQRKHAACQAAIARLASVLAEVQPDVLVIVGNDQMEVFRDGLIPAFTVFHGERIVNNPLTPQRLSQLPEGVRGSIPGYIPESGGSYAGVPELGLHIAATAAADGFDIAAMSRLPGEETPHAFGFVYRQLLADRPMPSVPVILNTFYPPNQPRVERCYAFGKVLLRAIESWNEDARVALVASGGLTHFVINEEVDGILLEAMQTHDVERVFALGETIFQDGTSEAKNWLPVAAAMAELKLPMHLVDYVPCYRSEAGTGNAMAFVYWKP